MPRRSVLPAIIYPGRQRVRWHPLFQGSNYAAALRFAGYYLPWPAKGAVGTLVSGKQLLPRRPVLPAIIYEPEGAAARSFQESNYAAALRFAGDHLPWPAKGAVGTLVSGKQLLPRRPVLPAII